MGDGRTENLPDLDYAFLAEYAKVESHGTLTAVGASFTEAGVPVPGAMAVSVAGRLRLAEGSAPVDLGLKFSGPSVDTPRLEMTAEVGTGDARPYEGRVGVLFAVNVTLPIAEAGLHEMLILIDGRPVRTLKFNVSPHR